MSVKNKLISFYLLIFMFLFIINYLQPFVADDFGFYLRPFSFIKYLELLRMDYYTWTGRISAELVVIVLNKALWPYTKIPLAIFNSLLLIWALRLMQKIVEPTANESNKILFTLFYIIFFTATLNFAATFIWKTVALQYLLGFAITTWVISKLYNSLQARINISKVDYLMLGLSAIFIGFYNEVFLGFLYSLYLTSIICIMLWNKSNLKKFITTPSIASFYILLSIAGALSIIAPGNFIRRHDYLMNHPNLASVNLFTKFAMTYIQFFRYGYHVAIAILFIPIYRHIYKSRYSIPPSIYKTFWFLLILLNITIISFIEIAYFSPISGRMLIFIDSIIYIIFYLYLGHLIFSNNTKIAKNKRLTNQLLNATYFVITIFLLYNITAYIRYYNFMQNRDKYITQAKTHNIMNITLPSFNGQPVLWKFPVYYYDIKNDSNFYINKYIAQYFQIKSIKSNDK